ncbi:MAG: tRNA (adenosine(37)-N6)-threonylcarbamoyltransferase complex dimerization subunit type 1 TsaB [Desulfobacterales bacterium]|nr:tRNA (adenosine(37)-N6)-threonylcarbamoyltransferase complex dimerization subunit type 1 TsaB [Desulfobacterales bacterium]
MRILALDTATEVCGLALWVDGQVQAERRIKQGLTHTKVLMPALRTLLQEAGMQATALDGWAVTQGPGSFTGLRIGISAVKGLALATGQPFAGVSTLAVLAHQAPAPALWVCPMIDARRQQVYWSLYRRQGDDLVPVLPERAGSVEEAMTLIGDRGPCLFIGNGARLYSEMIQVHMGVKAQLADDALHDLQPGMVARLGSRRLAQGTAENLHHFTPVYLRSADAQMPSAGVKRSAN